MCALRILNIVLTPNPGPIPVDIEFKYTLSHMANRTVRVTYSLPADGDFRFLKNGQHVLKFTRDVHMVLAVENIKEQVTIIKLSGTPAWSNQLLIDFKAVDEAIPDQYIKTASYTIL